LDIFLASRCTEYAIAAACLGGLPALISVAIFFDKASLDFDLIKGI
jgi:hypothetical protein